MRRRHRQLGAECATSSRLSRGVVGGIMGGVAGGVIGLLVGAVVGFKKINDASSQTAPFKASIGAAAGVTALGILVGATASAIQPEC